MVAEAQNREELVAVPCIAGTILGKTTPEQELAMARMKFDTDSDAIRHAFYEEGILSPSRAAEWVNKNTNRQTVANAVSAVKNNEKKAGRLTDDGKTTSEEPDEVEGVLVFGDKSSAIRYANEQGIRGEKNIADWVNENTNQEVGETIVGAILSSTPRRRAKKNVSASGRGRGRPKGTGKNQLAAKRASESSNGPPVTEDNAFVAVVTAHIKKHGLEETLQQVRTIETVVRMME